MTKGHYLRYNPQNIQSRRNSMAKVKDKVATDKKRALKLFQRNRIKEAESIYARLCRNNTQDIEAYHMLGMMQGRQNRFSEATESFGHALKLQPNAPVLHYLMGGTLLSLQRSDEALRHFEQAVQLKPDFHEAHIQVASLYNEMEQHHKAREIYENVLQHQPQSALAHAGLGLAYQLLGGIKEAIGCYENALKYDAKMTDIHFRVGQLLNNMGENEKAKMHFMEARRLKPDYLPAIAGEAMVYEWEKEYDKAWELIRPYIEKGVKQGDLATVFAQICKHIDRCDEAIQYLEQLLDTFSPTDKSRRQIHFSLGKLYDSNKDYDRAFEHYHKANAFKRPEAYDPMAHATLVSTLINTFSPKLMAELPRANIDTSKAVFIVGMPRSGTSLTEQILASHPQVHGAGELGEIHLITNALPPLLDPQLGYPRCLTKLTQTIMDGMAKQYIHVINLLASDALRVTDKMPHNFLHLGLIALLFPNARIIHCQRDPMDTCLSNYFQNFSAGLDFADDLADLGQHFREYDKLMQHWKQVIGLPILEINYEDLVNKQEAETRRLLEFLDLPWDDRCLSFHKAERVVGTASYNQVREPLYTKSVARWKHYEPHLDELKKAL